MRKGPQCSLDALREAAGNAREVMLRVEDDRDASYSDWTTAVRVYSQAAEALARTEAKLEEMRRPDKDRVKSVSQAEAAAEVDYLTRMFFTLVGWHPQPIDGAATAVSEPAGEHSGATQSPPSGPPPPTPGQALLIRGTLLHIRTATSCPHAFEVCEALAEDAPAVVYAGDFADCLARVRSEVSIDEWVLVDEKGQAVK